MVTENVADHAGEQDPVLVCMLERKGVRPRMLSYGSFGKPHEQPRQARVGVGADQLTVEPDVHNSDATVAR
jgi:hypothetical protein